MPTKPEFTFRYKIRNWPEYNRALIRRGQLTLWFDEATVAGWRDTHCGGRGRPRVYADTAIECALVLKCVFHLSLRATQGFLQSIATMMNLDLPIPTYSTVCRRQKALAVHLPMRIPKDARHIVIDSTGLKVYGAGEWHAKKHRVTRRRTWRKLHLGVDETSKEVLAVELTPNSVHETLRQIRQQGHYAWRLSSGCSRQSLAENAMYRFKTLMGGGLSARTFENQQVEALTKCAVLNRMAALGLPESERVL